MEARTRAWPVGLDICRKSVEIQAKSMTTIAGDIQRQSKGPPIDSMNGGSDDGAGDDAACDRLRQTDRPAASGLFRLGSLCAARLAGRGKRAPV